MKNNVSLSYQSLIKEHDNVFQLILIISHMARISSSPDSALNYGYSEMKVIDDISHNKIDIKKVSERLIGSIDLSSPVTPIVDFKRKKNSTPATQELMMEVLNDVSDDLLLDYE